MGTEIRISCIWSLKRGSQLSSIFSQIIWFLKQPWTIFFANTKANKLHPIFSNLNKENHNDNILWLTVFIETT